MSDRRSLEAVDDLVRVLKRVRTADRRAFVKAILGSERVFVTGLGRTGLMARGFAMRLMHLGRRVFHVGDVITPSIAAGDLLIICSRTGRSAVLRHYISIARHAKAQVAVVTADAQSGVAKAADVLVWIDDRPGARRGKGAPLPLGSLFEQALLIVLDHAVLDLMEALHLTEADMRRVHTKFE
jgi:6-phospho-3-hexuloisomerase